MDIYHPDLGGLRLTPPVFQFKHLSSLIIMTSASGFTGLDDFHPDSAAGWFTVCVLSSLQWLLP